MKGLRVKINENEFIWVEKYRPQKICDILLPESVKAIFKGYIDSNEIPNLLLTSNSAGLGKTSIAKILVNETKGDLLFLNGNLDTGIDVMRSRVIDFCSSVSIDDNPKFLLIDEAENISPLAANSLKALLESFTNITFIFTANFVNKLPEPIRNRLQHYDFDDIYFRNKQEIGKEILKRLIFILQNENITFNKEDLPKVVKAHYPSVRGMIHALQKMSSNGELILSDVLHEGSNIFNTLVQTIKEKDFNKMRSTTANVLDCGGFYEFMFKNLDLLVDESKPHAILTLAKYQNMDSVARDKEITLSACCVELMSSCKFV